MSWSERMPWEEPRKQLQCQDSLPGHKWCSLPKGHEGEHQHKATKKEREADALAASLASSLGPKWKPETWLHYGWHVSAKRGRVRIERIRDARAGQEFLGTCAYRKVDDDPQNDICVHSSASTAKKALRDLVDSLELRRQRLVKEQELVMAARDRLAKALKVPLLKLVKPA